MTPDQLTIAKNLKYVVMVEPINGVQQKPQLARDEAEAELAPVPLNREAKIYDRSAKVVAVKAAGQTNYTWTQS